ncbi:hypothetical protein L1887_25749 [Cichorium endivia]|nr:hypothetical protein L1887_25749 [Cichorium endivia]
MLYHVCKDLSVFWALLLYQPLWLLPNNVFLLVCAKAYLLSLYQLPTLSLKRNCSEFESKKKKRSNHIPIGLIVAPLSDETHKIGY